MGLFSWRNKAKPAPEPSVINDDGSIRVRGTISDPALRHATLYRLARYEDALASVLAGNWVATESAELTVQATATGKYAGQPFVTVSIRGAVIGEIPAQFAHKHTEVYDAIVHQRYKRAFVKIFAGGDGEGRTALLFVEPA